MRTLCWLVFIPFLYTLQCFADTLGPKAYPEVIAKSAGVVTNVIRAVNGNRARFDVSTALGYIIAVEPDTQGGQPLVNSIVSRHEEVFRVNPHAATCSWAADGTCLLQFPSRTLQVEIPNELYGVLQKASTATLVRYHMRDGTVESRLCVQGATRCARVLK